MTDTGARDYEERSYGAHEVGLGRRPGIVVVDFQKGFTEARYPLGGAPLIMQAVAQTERLLKAARRNNVPIATCNTAYRSWEDMPHWKITAVREEFLHGHPSVELDPRIYEPDYDVFVTKTGPSIFFQTPVVPYFVKQQVDTVIVTGCTTSGCIRASSIDSFQWGFRTIVAEGCVGDHEERPHNDNLRDISRRYVDLKSTDDLIAYLEDCGRRNARD
ncbi:hydrolase [Phormidium willei BDU 130791]|nr:hydrolase [Phormidium willei BDU 130791]